MTIVASFSRYDEPKGDSLKDTNYFQKVYFHKLGTPQSADVLAYERPDQKDWLFSGFVTEDGNYLILSIYFEALTQRTVSTTKI